PKPNQATRKCDPKSNKTTRNCDSETITVSLNNLELRKVNGKNYAIVELTQETVDKFTPNITIQPSTVNSNNITSNIRTGFCPSISYLPTNNEIPNTSAQTIPLNNIQRNDLYVQQPYDFQSPLPYYPPNQSNSYYYWFHPYEYRLNFPTPSDQWSPSQNL
ncbi:26293_t:CDS:2, partial [Gigaspora rosea]